MNRKRLLLLALVLSGCAPIAGSGFAWVVVLAAVAWCSSTAMAGERQPPKPCAANETTAMVCRDNRIQQSCYPAVANYAVSPYVDCGSQRCVYGTDPGFCPPDTPRFEIDATQATCSPSLWQKACVKNTVTEVCIISVPTNYAGPDPNPSYNACQAPTGERCAIHKDPLKCFPTKGDLQGKACDGEYAFRRVCIDTRPAEVCVPNSAPYPGRTEFADCGNNHCATTKNLCQ